MKSLLPPLLVAGAALLLPRAPAADDPVPKAGPVAADLVLRNGKIWTVNKKQPRAEALAVSRDRTFAGKLPTAEMVDQYVSGRPVFMRRYDGHMALVNTRALKLAGITAATPDPTGGIIVRKPGGKEPSGVLRDTAMGLVGAHVPR